MSNTDFDTIGPGNQSGSPLNIAPSGASTGTSGGATSPFSLNASSLGPAAAAGGGLAALLLFGGGPNLPPQDTTVEGNAGALEGEAGTLWGSGNSLIASGQSALGPAVAGQLTPEQQATLTSNQQGLQNIAAQDYASMGRNANQDTSFISTQADIDTKMLAAANNFVNTNIATAITEITTGSSLSSAGSQDMNSANNALLAVAQQQMQADQAYSSALTGAFSAIGSIAGTIGGAAIGGPAGAVIGGTVGKNL